MPLQAGRGWKSNCFCQRWSKFVRTWHLSTVNRPSHPGSRYSAKNRAAQQHNVGRSRLVACRDSRQRGVEPLFLGVSDISIHLVDPDSPGSQFKLPSPVVYTSDVRGLSWSPDATRLVVSRGRDNSQVPPYDIQIVTLQATDCPPGAPVCEVQPRQSLVRDIVGSPLMTADSLLNPRWGNSGAEIAVSAHIPPNGNSDIWAIPVLNPINARNLTNTNKVTPPDRHETLPTWSPNDSQIAYGAGFGGGCISKDKNVSGIMVRNVDGSSFPDGCKEKILIKDGNFPSWWRNHGVPQP